MQEARYKKSYFLFSFLCLFSFSLNASMVSSVTLEELAKGADIVFRGVCKEKHEEKVLNPQTGRQTPVVIYTFQTKDVIKGDVESVVEVKQWGIKTRTEAVQLGLPQASAASFVVGKEYLVFLGSQTATVHQIIGGAQGLFEITRDKQGNSVVVNPFNNKGLFQGTPQKTLSKSEQSIVQAPQGPVPYDDFASLVRKTLRD